MSMKQIQSEENMELKQQLDYSKMNRKDLVSFKRTESKDFIFKV